MREWSRSESFLVSVAAAENSEGPVSCLISHKITVSKWAGLAASPERKDFLLSLLHNRLTGELAVRGASLSLVGQEVKKGMNPSCLSTTSSFLVNLFISISNTHKCLNVNAVRSSFHWERLQRKKKINIFDVKWGRDQTEHTLKCRDMRGTEWSQQIPLHPHTNYTKRRHSTSFK